MTLEMASVAMDVEVAIALRYAHPPPLFLICSIHLMVRMFALASAISFTFCLQKRKKGRVNTPPPVVETLRGWCSLTFAMIPLARNDGLAYLSRKPVVFNY